MERQNEKPDDPAHGEEGRPAGDEHGPYTDAKLEEIERGAFESHPPVEPGGQPVPEAPDLRGADARGDNPEDLGRGGD